jgi:hypothetical protein
MFRVIVKDTSSSDQYDIPFTTVDFTDELNNSKNATFYFDYAAVEEVAQVYGKTALFVLSGGFREIWLEKDGTKVYYGAISDYSVSKDSSGVLKITVASVGFFSLLAKRRTGAKRVFTTTDAGTIAWTLINESQTGDTYGDLGITMGTIQTSVDRDRTFRFASLREEIWQMSNANLKNGFDFEVDNNKVFNVYYAQKGSQREDIFFDEKNIISYSFRKPLVLNLTNRVYVLGGGFNDDVIYETRDSAADYRVTFGLLEDVLSSRNVEETDTLQDKGDGYLLKNQSPIVEISITHADGEPNIEDYDIGDSVRIRMTEMNIIDEWRRIYKRTVKIDNNGAAIVTLDLK